MPCARQLATAAGNRSSCARIRAKACDLWEGCGERGAIWGKGGTEPGAAEPGTSLARLRIQTKDFFLPCRRPHQHSVRRSWKRPCACEGGELAHASRIRLGKSGLGAATAAS